MLSYKEYKLLNESLYGAFNLGLKSQNTVAGIVSDSPVNGTDAAIEAESEEAIEEAKKMKKKMLGDEDSEKKVKVTDEVDDDHEDDEDHDDKEDEDEGDEDEGDEDEGDEDEGDEDEGDEDEKDLSFMKKKMNKKSKKEWSEVIADLEEVLEAVDDEEALTEVKKGLEMMKKGMEKGMKKHMGSDCKKCCKYMSEGKKHKEKDHDKEEDGDEGHDGLTTAQKKLPKALQDAILAKKRKKGEKEDKKCGKNMNEDEAAWWNSVNSMLGSNPDHKNWDGGWKEVGEVQQAVREGDHTGNQG